MTLEKQYRNVLILLAVVIVAGSTYWILRHFRPSLFIGELVPIAPIEAPEAHSPSEPVKSALGQKQAVAHLGFIRQHP